MAKKKNQKPLLPPDQLEAKIDRIVAIRPVANEYRALCAEVKEDLLARGLEEFATRDLNRAVIVRSPVTVWLLDKLCGALPRAVFETLCPRKPDARKLAQRLAATPEDTKLAACQVADPEAEKAELEVLAPGEPSTEEKRALTVCASLRVA